MSFILVGCKKHPPFLSEASTLPLEAFLLLQGWFCLHNRVSPHCLVLCQHRGLPRASFVCSPSSTCLEMSRHYRTVTFGACCAARLILLKGLGTSQENALADVERVVLTLTFVNLCAVDHSGCHHLIRFSITQDTLQLMAKTPVGGKKATTLHGTSY